MVSDLRKRLGARLLIERRQVKDWNELAAARAAGIQPKTIRRIERGLNYEMKSLEKYAVALGKPLAAWLIDVLIEETQRGTLAPAAEATFHDPANLDTTPRTHSDPRRGSKDHDGRNPKRRTS